MGDSVQYNWAWTGLMNESMLPNHLDTVMANNKTKHKNMRRTMPLGSCICGLAAYLFIHMYLIKYLGTLLTYIPNLSKLRKMS